jgi:hypothetical protein
MGWFFTRAGGAYVAVRPVNNDAYVIHSIEDGKMLDLPDMWAPVIVQMGRTEDYPDFDAFRASVQANRVMYEDGHLTYDSEAGDVYEFWSRGVQLPRINGHTPSLNPAKTYSSPYILGWHGEDIVTLSYPGVDSLVLDFSY